MTACRCGATWTGKRMEHCTQCHQTFSGTITGDLHRTGEHGVKSGHDRRRCRTPEEMLALRTSAGEPRLKQNDRGIWIGGGESPFARAAIRPTMQRWTARTFEEVVRQTEEVFRQAHASGLLDRLTSLARRDLETWENEGGAL